MRQDELHKRLQDVNLDALPLDKQVGLFFKHTDLIRRFVGDRIIPVLQRRIKAGLNHTEEAIMLTYFRMYYWIDSLSRLSELRDFQAINAAARAIFELGLDMQLLVNDRTGSMGDKFHAFRSVHMFAVARKCTRFCDGASSTASPAHDDMRQLLAKPNEDKRVETLRRKHWGLNNKGELIEPGHWTGMDARKRAKELDKLLGPEHEKEYVEDYARLSWHVHSGSLGFANLPLTYFKSVFATAHGIARHKFTEATQACVQAMHIDDALSGWEEELGNLEAQLLISTWEQHRSQGGDG